jgi:hypothetical protein
MSIVSMLRSEQDALIEALRLKYRPPTIYTLFVGESAPASGKFFYRGDSSFTRHMENAFGAAYGISDVPFLTRFKAFGWYLDDLVLTPVDDIKDRKNRRERCFAARVGLAERIADYRPRLVVSLARSIDDDVRTAAGSVPFRAMSFPGNGHQGKLLSEMVRMRDELPRSESGL